MPDHNVGAITPTEWVDDKQDCQSQPLEHIAQQEVFWSAGTPSQCQDVRKSIGPNQPGVYGVGDIPDILGYACLSASLLQSFCDTSEIAYSVVDYGYPWFNGQRLILLRRRSVKTSARGTRL